MREPAAGQKTSSEAVIDKRETASNHRKVLLIIEEREATPFLTYVQLQHRFTFAQGCMAESSEQKSDMTREYLYDLSHCHLSNYPYKQVMSTLRASPVKRERR